MLQGFGHKKRGTDIEVPLTISFEGAINGLITDLSVRRSEFCSQCGGLGKTGGSQITCSVCKGIGRVSQTETVKVRIPAGVDTGSRIRMPGKGEADLRGGIPGDLYIITNLSPHPVFTRKGDNIYSTIQITPSEAAMGAEIEVPTVSGKAPLTIPPGTQSGQCFRLRERGVPRQPGNARGDQYVKVKIVPQDH
jgi:DnaJ-class molecular chaperone